MTPLNTRFEQSLALHRGGQLDAAAQGYEALLAQDPRPVEVLIHFGSLRLAQGRAPEAEALLRRAVAVADDSAPAHGTLAAARVYADTPAHLHGVALRSLRAHLLKLQADGRALHLADSDGGQSNSDSGQSASQTGGTWSPV